jgi:hypothetical protein
MTALIAVPDPEDAARPAATRRITVTLTVDEARALARASVAVTSTADRATARAAESALRKCRDAAARRRTS